MKFSDSSYDILKTYFDIIKNATTGSDNSYILSQNHTIVADGGVFTKLYQENDYNDMIAHNFRIVDIIGNNFVFKYEGIASTHSQATVLEVNKPMYFRKDEKFRDWLVNNVDIYENYINTDKLFIYFGRIYPVADNTGTVGINYNIQFEGMKNFVSEALPENNRSTNLEEFLKIYYDEVAQPIYNMTKTLWSFFDAKEVNLKHLDYLATRAGISTDKDLIAELPLREFVDNLPYWMKRKSSYASYYIAHKILLANTRNKLNIYERWAEWCLRDLRGDKNYTLPTDYETHHIMQHYGAYVSGGAGPEYYDQWNTQNTDQVILTPTGTATDTADDQNTTNGWTANNCGLLTNQRPNDEFSMEVISQGVSAYAASDNLTLNEGYLYHFEYDAGAIREGTHEWRVLIESSTISVAGLVYDSGWHRGYGESPNFNSFVTSGAEFTPAETATDYQIHLNSRYETNSCYFDNVFLTKVGLPKTGNQRPYPTYSELPSADCRANTWNFGDPIAMEDFETRVDDDNVLTGKYSGIFQVDAYTPSAALMVDETYFTPQPSIIDHQSPSAAGEYNHYLKVNMDSFSKPSGGMLIWGMYGAYSAGAPDNITTDLTHDYGEPHLALEYQLRHRDGNYTSGTPPYDGSAQSGPARKFSLIERYQDAYFTVSTSGDYYRPDTEYFIGVHKSTSAFKKVHIAENMIQLNGFSATSSANGLIDNNLTTTGFTNATSGNNVYIDMGEGNNQAITMCRLHRIASADNDYYDIEASPDGFTAALSAGTSIPLIKHWQPADTGWNKAVWHNTNGYRFFRIKASNGYPLDATGTDVYSQMEFYTGDSTDKPELRANIYDKIRMKNPDDLLETIRMQIHEDDNYQIVFGPSQTARNAPQSAVTSASLYFDIENMNMSGGFTRSIAPTGHLVLTPHYKVEIDLSSEPMAEDKIISVGQAEEIIRYWTYLKPVDKFVEHHFMISPLGKIDELHESVSLYDPLKLGICDTRFTGVQTLATTAAPANTNLLDNYLMDDEGYWIDWESPATQARSSEQFYSPSASRKIVIDAQYEGMYSQFFSAESGFEYETELMVYPVDVTQLRVGVKNPDTSNWESWSYINEFTGLTTGIWNKVKFKYTETSQGPYGRLYIGGGTGDSSGTFYIDNTYLTKGKLDLFANTSVEKRTYATDEWPITHNLADTGVMTQIFDPDENILYPKRLEIVDENRIRAYFNAGQRGRAFTAAMKTWGSPSATRYHQTVAASAWDITHSLGTSGASGVCYQCYNDDLSSNIVPGDVQIIDINTLRVTFPEDVAGYCFIRDDDYYHIQSNASDSWTVNHNINARGLICHTYDHDGYRQYPETIEMVDYNTARIDWSEPVSGTACFIFFQREFTDETLLAAMGASGGSTDITKDSQLGYWKIGAGNTLGFDPLTANDLDSVTLSGNIEDIRVTTPNPSGSILFDFSVPKEDAYTITEMGVFDLNKNLQYYTKTSELHKPENVQLDVKYRIKKLPTVV